jgi:hypothetical protein
MGRHRIGREIYLHGAMERESILNFICADGRHRYTVFHAVDAMVRDGQLIDRNGMLDINEEMRARFAEIVAGERRRVKPVLVPPREARAFKPLNMGMYDLVRERLDRSISFMNGGSTAIPYRKIGDE